MAKKQKGEQNEDEDERPTTRMRDRGAIGGQNNEEGMDEGTRQQDE